MKYLVLFFILIYFSFALHSQDIKAVAAFQNYHQVSYGNTYVPEVSEFQWVKNKGFNVIHGNWPNDFYSINNCNGKYITECGNLVPNTNKRQLIYDLDLYLQRANQYGLKIVFNLELFLYPKGGPYPDPYTLDKKGLESFINYVKNNPATYGYITFDEPNWRSVPEPIGVWGHDISLEDQINFYNIVKSIDPNHPIFGTDPVGYCGSDYEPADYCPNTMVNFSNGSSFDFFAQEIGWELSHYPNTMLNEIENWRMNKIKEFYQIYDPDYPVLTVTGGVRQEIAESYEIPNYGTMMAEWRAFYKANLLTKHCSDSFAIFGWSFPPSLALNPTFEHNLSFSSGILKGSGPYIGFYQDGDLMQAVENFMSAYNYYMPWCPACTSIQILPNSLPEAFVNNYYYVQLNANSSYTPFYWNILNGSLPNGMNFGESSGTIYGTPQNAGFYNFEVAVVDDQEKSCAGYRNYQLVVCPQDSLLTNVETLWQGRVSEYFSKEIPVYCGLPPYTITILSGQLPSGIMISQATFQGTPTQKGYYTFRFQVADSQGKTVERNIEFIVFGEGEELFAIPWEGTVWGGTRVTIYSYSGVFQSNSNVTFTIKNWNCTSTITGRSAEDVTYYSPYKIVAVTPKAIEGCSDINVVGPFGTTYKLINGYAFKTLGYTSNQVGQNVSVIDTIYNKLFDTNFYTSQIEPFPFDEPIVPFGTALTKDGRKILIPDFYSGNLKIADASNFEVKQTIVLQDPEIAHFDPGAFDVAVSEDGRYAYVAHMTQGTAHISPPPWNPSGSISVIELKNDQFPSMPPHLIDIDNDPSTTTLGAPAGITRIEPPQDWRFVPLSIEDVSVFKTVAQYNVGDKFPGEYLFLSGVGPALWSWITDPPHCSPQEICKKLPVLLPRPIEVAVVDLNPYKVTGKRIENGKIVLDLVINFMYRKFLKLIPIGSDGEFPSDQGLSFFKFENNENAYIYAVNPAQNKAAIIDYNTLELVKDQNGNPIFIQTGQNPTDVKVQKVEDTNNPGNYFTYAYITNALDDSVTVIDTATNSEITDSPINIDMCYASENYPTSFDTRSTGDFGYSSNFYSNTVSPFYLPTNSCYSPPNSDGAIHVGEAPIRIVIQTVPTIEALGGGIIKELDFANPEVDFTQPSKQSILLQDWEHIEELTETKANEQAIVANIDNFEKNAEKWVKNEKLMKNVIENAELYKAYYLKGKKK